MSNIQTLKSASRCRSVLKTDCEQIKISILNLIFQLNLMVFMCSAIYCETNKLMFYTPYRRFVVETVRKLKEDCYISTLRILEAQKSDSFTYELRLSNAHGTDRHAIHLVIRGKMLKKF